LPGGAATGIKAARAATLAKNIVRGKKGEAATATRLGTGRAGGQVTIRSSTGSKARVDHVTEKGTVVESKTGKSPLSKGQRDVQADIKAGRPVTPVGKNAKDAGLKPGKPILMRNFIVHRTDPR